MHIAQNFILHGRRNSLDSHVPDKAGDNIKASYHVEGSRESGSRRYMEILVETP